MLNLIRNTKKRQRKDSRSSENVISFRLSKENQVGIRKEMFTAEFMNRAIYFYRLLNSNPKRLMMELKRSNPELWKYVNRKKFL